MLSFLKSWLMEHIRGVDTKYSSALREVGFSLDVWECEVAAEAALMSNSKKWWELWKLA
jgi:hemerythrin